MHRGYSVDKTSSIRVRLIRSRTDGAGEEFMVPASWCLLVDRGSMAMRSEAVARPRSKCAF
jgi:hypothetical protein